MASFIKKVVKANLDDFQVWAKPEKKFGTTNNFNLLLTLESIEMDPCNKRTCYSCSLLCGWFNSETDHNLFEDDCVQQQYYNEGNDNKSIENVDIEEEKQWDNFIYPSIAKGNDDRDVENEHVDYEEGQEELQYEEEINCVDEVEEEEDDDEEVNNFVSRFFYFSSC